MPSTASGTDPRGAGEGGAAGRDPAARSASAGFDEAPAGSSRAFVSVPISGDNARAPPAPLTIQLGEPRYRARELLVIPAGQGAAWVHEEGGTSISMLPQTDAELLRRCSRWLTLDEHLASVIRQAPAGTPEAELRGALERLVSQGLFESEDELRRELARAPQQHDPPDAIRTLVIVTCERAELLERCLRSYRDNAVHFGRELRFVVVDDSKTTESTRATRTVLAELRASLGADIVYVGTAERRRFVDAAAARGQVPRELLEFALLDPAQLGHTVGANRNAALLATLDERFLSVDDDTVCRLGRAPRASDEVRFFSGHDPTDFWFFPDIDAALAAVALDDVDFVAQHDAVLGRAPGSHAGGAAARVDVDEMSSAYARRARTAAARVLFSSNGLVGDCGMGMPRYFLGLLGDSRARLMEEHAYYAAFTSRQVIRAARSVTVADGAHLMMPAVGLDNRALLPPFLPVLGNEDGIFALVARKCHDAACIAHLPSLVTHLPPGSRSFPPDIASVYRLCVSDVILGLLASIAIPACVASPADRMLWLGDHIVQIADSSTKHFVEDVWVRYATASSRYISHLESCLRAHDWQPEHWARDVAALIDAIRGGVARGPVPPVDLPATAGSYDSGWVLLQRLLGRFARLLRAWPDIRTDAIEMRASGFTLGETR